MALEKKTNIVVFFTDQQRWDTLGIHGNPLGLTPNLDYAAQNGVDLHRTFTSQPVCGPARALLQTGMYPTATGCYRNGLPLSRKHRTLADYFNENGYETGYIGKWHLGVGVGAQTEEMRGGYQYWLASNALEFTSDAYKTFMYDGDGNRHRLPGYRVDAVADAGIRYINENRDNPFFLFMSFIEPHFQNHLDNYPAPDAYAKRYAGRYTPPDLEKLSGSAPAHLGGYYGMVKRLDEAYGRLIDALKSLDLLENTVVLFTSDHGCHFKTRNSEYKRSGHESSIRIPAVLYGGKRAKGMKIQNLLSLIDLPPTLLELAGIPIPDCMQGKSVVPLIEQNHAQWDDEVYVQISEAGTGRALRTKRWKYIVHSDTPDDAFGGCSEAYHEVEFYDLKADPYELTNLIGLDVYSEVIAGLRSRLMARAAQAGEPPMRIIEHERGPSGQRKIDLV